MLGEGWGCSPLDDSRKGSGEGLPSLLDELWELSGEGGPLETLPPSQSLDEPKIALWGPPSQSLDVESAVGALLEVVFSFLVLDLVLVLVLVLELRLCCLYYY